MHHVIGICLASSRVPESNRFVRKDGHTYLKIITDLNLSRLLILYLFLFLKRTPKTRQV